MATAIVYKTSSGNERRLELDAALSRESTKSVEVTRFPVENGSVISDHAIRSPDCYRLEGLISNTPAIARERLEVMIEAGTVVTQRAQDARDRLEEISEQKLPVTIEAGGRQFPNMIMTSLVFPEDASTGDAVRFSASFEQVRTVATLTERVPQAPDAAAGKVKGGRKPTEQADDSVKKRAESGAVQIRNAAKNLLGGG
jgi:hypothetical protein